MWVAGMAHLLNGCVKPRWREQVAAIVMVESGGWPYALDGIGINRSLYPRSLSRAVKDADGILAGGHAVAIGLAQINSDNVIRFHLQGRNLFNGCTNLRVAEEVLKDCYRMASRVVSSRSKRELAWSCYYSGNFWQGFVPYHGRSYVGSVETAFRRITSGEQ